MRRNLMKRRYPNSAPTSSYRPAPRYSDAFRGQGRFAFWLLVIAGALAVAEWIVRRIW